MKSNFRLLLGTVAASLLCSAANARGILIDGWTQTSTGTTTSVTVDPTALPAGPILGGITALSFAPGTSTPGFIVATIPGFLDTEYAFGGSATNPLEQIVIDPLFSSTGTTNQFLVSFNYADGFGGAGETASLTVNNVTYTAKNPGALNDTTGVFEFIGGVLQNVANYATTWTTSTGGGGGGGGGTMNAPEIDPASATSALTLLAGGIAIMLSSKRRKLRQQSI